MTKTSKYDDIDDNDEYDDDVYDDDEDDGDDHDYAPYLQSSAW